MAIGNIIIDMKITSFLKYFISLIFLSLILLVINRKSNDVWSLEIILLVPILIQSLYWSKKEITVENSKLRFYILNFFTSGLVITFLLYLVASILGYVLSGGLGLALFSLYASLQYIYILIAGTIILSIHRFFTKKNSQTLSP